MEYLSKVIYQKPRLIERSFITSKYNDVLEANDKFYRENKSLKGWISWSIGLSLIFIGLVLMLIFNDYNKGTFIVITVTAWLPSIIAIVYGFVAPKKTLVFNRLKGIITVAPRFQKEFDIPFETGVGIRALTHSDTGGVDQHLSFSVSKEKKRKGGIISMVKVDDSWAFMVWYMDRNRPLPPGDAFDAYREQDYERRKAEGFPLPLFTSTFDTPEATPEQKAERKRIGRW
ncbi:hypothetical protein [Saccharicrinis aurantiacus]|uniref:hypothetical protein n=1 Tax=Saccharicrinis aurantiacus TaxID=1849719 RepID=UPI00249206C1|nr:hypothetical protein [Saccharicrinis aurantiacus]